MISFHAKIINRLLSKIAGDDHLLATHVSLFTALLLCWNRNKMAIPFTVNRKELMSFSKISSIATYHKCIKDLDALGYIIYQPSYHPHKASKVYWKVFESKLLLP